MMLPDARMLTEDPFLDLCWISLRNLCADSRNLHYSDVSRSCARDFQMATIFRRQPGSLRDWNQAYLRPNARNGSVATFRILDYAFYRSSTTALSSLSFLV